MTKEEFENLDTGDVIRQVFDAHGYVVISNYGSRVVAVHTVEATNPEEWILASKVIERGPSK